MSVNAAIEKLAEAVQVTAKSQEELAAKVNAEIKARSDNLGDWDSVTKMQDSIQKLVGKDGEGVVKLQSAVKDLQEMVGAHDKLVAGLSGGDTSDSPLVCMDPAYFSPKEKRYAPNAKAAAAMAVHMRAVMTKGQTHKDAVKLLEDDFGIKFQHVEDATERAGSIHDEEAGGIALPPELGAPIIAAIPAYGAVTSEAMLEPMTQPKKQFVKDEDEIDVVAVEEGATLSEVDRKLKMVSLEAKLWGAFTSWTADYEAYGLTSLGESWTSRFARAIAKKMDLCLTTADGTSAYNNMVGILNHADVPSVSMGAGKTAFSDADYDFLLSMISAVPDEVYEEGNCKFFLSGGIMHLLKGIKDGNGRPLFIDAVGGRVSQVIGEDIVRSAAYPKLSESGAGKKFLSFGDMRRTNKIGVKTQMTVLFSEHAFFLNAKNALRVLSRFGTVVASPNAMRNGKTADA